MAFNAQTVDHVTELVFQNRYGQFEQVYAERLHIFLKDVSLSAQKIEFLLTDPETMLVEIGHSVLQSLIQFGIRTMLTILYEHQAELKGDTPEARYADFIARYAVERFEDIFPTGSEARWLIENRLSFSLMAISELFDRLLLDREIIKTRLGLDIQSFQRVSISLGDTHDNGRSVCILTVNEREKLVYKPHSLYNDILLTKIFQWFSDQGGLKSNLEHIPVLDRGKYGWQRFVTNRPCSDRIQAEQYMYRLGALIFVSNVFSFSDLHFENLVANGAYPVIVDSETLSSNWYSFDGYTQQSVTPWVRLVRNSVFSTLLLPTELLEDKQTAHMDMSGLLGGIDNQKIKNRSHLINFGRDDICFDEGDVEVSIRDEVKNLAILDGQALHPGRYLEQISDGYSDAYDIVLNNKNTFLDFVMEGGFSKGIYRQVLRNTDLYCRFLEASYHPYYMQSRESRKALLSRIKGKNGYVNTAHERLVVSETEQMLRDDVPMFCARFDSLDLYPPYGEPIKEFFSVTLKNQLIRTIKKLSVQDKERQITFIQCALTEPGDLVSKQPLFRVDKNAIIGSDVKERACSFIGFLFDLREKQRIENEDGDAVSYYSIRSTAFARELVQDDTTLYEGGGAALLYLQLYKQFGEKYKLAAQHAVDSCLPQANETISLDTTHVGLFKEEGSALYLSLQAYRILKDEKYMEIFKTIGGWFAQADLSACGETDVISGFSGSILFCLGAWEKDKSLQTLYDLAIRMGERLYEIYSEGKIEHQSGFAHGYAGHIPAFFALAKHTGKEDYYQAAVSLLQRENEMFLPDGKGWKDTRENMRAMNMWCYGAAGILVSRMISLRYAREKQRDVLEKDISFCVSLLVESTHEAMPAILCHGSVGNLDVLLWYLCQREDDQLRHFVDEKTDALLRFIQHNGIPTEVFTRGLNGGLMLGISGLAYYLLRYLHPSTPSVLAIETL